MITATMTAQDIWISTYRDGERMRKKADVIARKLTGEARKRRVNSVCKCVDYSHGSIEYKIFVRGKRDTSWDWNCYVYCSESNEYVRMAYSVEAVMYISRLNTQALTPHFIRRISERLYHDSVFDTNRTLARFERDAMVSKRQMLACLYRNESTGDIVYSLLDGIALGHADAAKGIITLKTFVSYDMLKDSQRRAFDACTGLQAELRKKYGDDEEIGRRMCTDDEFADAVDRELDAYKPIYAEFFQKK